MRKTFRCRFNSYVGQANQDSVVHSIMAQFSSYDCNPEVTVESNLLTLSVDLSDNLTLTMVRDKLAFNFFIDSVKVSEGIGKIRKMLLPKPVSSWITAETVGKDTMTGIRDGDEDNINIELPEGARPDMSKLIGGAGVVVGSWTKQADPQGNLVVSPFSGTDESVDPDLLSDIRDVEASRKTATEQDGGGLAGFGGGIGETNVRTSPTNPPRQTKSPQPSILGVPTNAWFTDDVLAGETITPNPNAEAPLSLPTGAKKELGLEHSALELPGAGQGGEFVPGDTEIEGWFTAFKQLPVYFGLNDNYEDYDTGDL